MFVLEKVDQFYKYILTCPNYEICKLLKEFQTRLTYADKAQYHQVCLVTAVFVIKLLWLNIYT